MQVAERWKPWIRAGVWFVAFVVACGVFIAVQSRPLFVSVLGVFAVLETARRLHESVRNQLLVDGTWGPVRVLWLSVLPVAGLVLLVVWRVGGRDGWGFFGAAVLYLGLGVLVAEVRRDVAWSLTGGLLVVGGCLAAGTIGVLAMAVFGAPWSWWLLGGALLLAPLGLGLLSEVGLDKLDRVSLRTQWIVPGIGLAVFALGLWLVAKDVNDTYTTLFAVVLVVLMLAIGARSSADALLVVAMTGLIWALTYRTAPVPESLVPADDKRTAVALGDSYISGEGADEFFEGTNAKDDNECRRAPTAYPVSLIEEEQPLIPEHLRLVFLACSGATTDGVHEQLAEFDQIDYSTDFDVEFVLVSVGGNDALFGSVAKTCLLPGDCSELGPAWTANLANVRDSLDAVYAEIDDTFAGVPVLVVPYPVPISEFYCSSSGFTRREHRFLHHFTVELNGVVRAAAAEVGFHYVSTMPTSLAQARARLCDRPEAQGEGQVEVGVNFLAANSVVGTLEQAGNPLNWFHNSLHPNEHGHGLMREAVVQWLDRVPPDKDLPARVEHPRTVAAEITAGDGPCVGAADLESCADRWRTKELGRFLITDGWIALLIVVSIWLFVLPLIRLTRTFFAED